MQTTRWKKLLMLIAVVETMARRKHYSILSEQGKAEDAAVR